MKKLIDQYARTVPQTQSAVGLSLIKAQQDSGLITSTDDFTKAYQTFLLNISQYDPQPLSQYQPYTNFRFVNSDNINLFYLTLEGDLISIFTEINYINQMIQMQSGVYNDCILNDFYKGLDQLKEEIMNLDKKNDSGILVSITTQFSQQNDNFLTGELVTLQNLIDITDPKSTEFLVY